MAGAALIDPVDLARELQESTAPFKSEEENP